MRRSAHLFMAAMLGLGCGSESEGNVIVPGGLEGVAGTGGAAAPGAPGGGVAASGLTLRADVTPVTGVEQAQPNVFIPPFEDCREPLPGETGSGPGGQVCTNVAISGCTEPGKRFADYASCEVVRTQRPFWPVPPYEEPRADDPRQQDAAFMGELSWVTEQIEAAGCVCCHDSRIVGGTAGEWDIALSPIWTDSLSDTGLALFLGLADSSVLGAYPAEQNHGFDRTRTGIPSTDSERMKAFWLAELSRRGLTEADAAAVPPFGGPIYFNSIAEPTACGAGEGIEPSGELRWNGGNARYVYVLAEGSKNPGVPPNLDLPEGTLWKLDVLASAAAVASGFAYGTTPAGSFQALPEAGQAPALQVGTTYRLYVLRDVGLPIANCTFRFGDAVPTEQPPVAGSTGSQAGSGGAGGAAGTGAGAGEGGTGGSDEGTCMPMDFFGAPCTDTVTHSECGCDAPYCAQQPGQAQGYCTATGCNTDPSVCPAGWSCFDISIFAPGEPAICLAP